jgi:hypothetical protein
MERQRRNLRRAWPSGLDACIGLAILCGRPVGPPHKCLVVAARSFRIDALSMEAYPSVMASTISAPGTTGGLAAGISKYRQPAPIMKLSTKPITIFTIFSLLRTRAAPAKNASHATAEGEIESPDALANAKPSNTTTFHHFVGWNGLIDHAGAIQCEHHRAQHARHPNSAHRYTFHQNLYPAQSSV